MPCYIIHIVCSDASVLSDPLPIEYRSVGYDTDSNADRCDSIDLRNIIFSGVM